jgi:hypothetical protein
MKIRTAEHRRVVSYPPARGRTMDSTPHSIAAQLGDRGTRHVDTLDLTAR